VRPATVGQGEMMKNPYVRGIIAFIVSWAVYTAVHIWVYGPIQKTVKHKYLATHSQFIEQALLLVYISLLFGMQLP